MTASTALTPRKNLMPLEEAHARLLQGLKPLETTSVGVMHADGRVLAHGVRSALEVPAFDNSAMDGYAVRAQDAERGAVLRVTQRIAAGHLHTQNLGPGEAARIFTGAAVPPGASAVVMQEHVQLREDANGSHITLQDAVQPGQNIRAKGEDVQLGSVVLGAGTRLQPAHLGLAASLGLTSLQVHCRPRVALFSTGDELVTPGDIAPEHLPIGKIYNSNRFFLHALLARLGCEVIDMGIVPDALDATVLALQNAAEQADVVLSSGGVSVGEEDHVKPAVQQLGALELWQVAMKPGKPFAFGHVRCGDGQRICHFLGLPGNPVSSFVTFVLLARPFLLRLQGMAQQDVLPPAHLLPAHFVVAKADVRREFLRVRRNAAGGLDLFPNQSSGVLMSMAWADGLVDKAAGQTIAHGDLLAYRPLWEGLL
jgi:molybdopterin molybdotransferase